MVRSMAQANGVYEVAVEANVRWTTVECDEFELFVARLQSLAKMVRNESDEQLWADVLRRFRSIRSSLTVAPIPFPHPFHEWKSRWSEFDALYERVHAQSTIDVVTSFNEVRAALEVLSRKQMNPLGEAVAERFSMGSLRPSAVLVPTSRFVGATDDVLDQLVGSRVKVLTPADLAAIDPLGTLVILGTTYWYRDFPFVFTAPRGRDVYFMRWSWVSDSIPEPELLIGARSGKRFFASQPPAPSNMSAIEGSELVPSIDWTAIVNRVGNSETDSSERLEEGRAYLLSGQRAVILSADLDASIYVVEPELTGDARVHTKDIAELREGDYVLLRAGGDGELITEMADRILGPSKAAQCRVSQIRWKAALRDEVRRTSLQTVIGRLKGLGCSKANYQNLRNWQSSRFIRTSSQSDFKAILDLVGMGDEVNQIWTEMGALKSAHVKAGFTISRMLRMAIVDADLDELVSTGVAEFHLDGQDVGSMTAYQVLAISPEVVSVDEIKIGKLVEAQASWLE